MSASLKDPARLFKSTRRRTRRNHENTNNGDVFFTTFLNEPHRIVAFTHAIASWAVINTNAPTRAGTWTR
jgi:hypothetical protein